jgi:K+ transporter
MYYQNQRSWRYRHRPIHRVVFRIYALLWLIPIVFFLAAPTPIGFLVTICIAVIIFIVIAIWHGRKEANYQRHIYYQRSYREVARPARLKQASRYERGYQGEEFAGYDDYEQPHAQYPGQRPSVPRK